MKTNFLIVIGVMMFTVIPISIGMVTFVYAAPPPDPEHAFNYSEIVIVGKIMDVRIYSQPILNEGANKAGIAVYDVLVIDALKNAEVEETITVPGLFFDEYDPIDTIGLVYEINDVVILYIQENHKEWNPDDLIIRSNESKKLFNCNDAIVQEIPVHQKYLCWPEPMGHPLRDISLSKIDDLERLEFIEKHCQNEEFREYYGKLRYVNDTHLIDLDTCQWDNGVNSGKSIDETVYSGHYQGDSRSSWEITLNDSLIAEFSSNIYQIPNVDFDKHSYTWGEQGKLFMISPLDNKDSQKIEVITTNSPTFKSKIYTYPDSTTQENFVLTETGPDTGLFEWTFVISEPQTKTAYDINSNYIVVSESTEHITFQFDVDQNTGYSTTAKVTYPDDNTLPSDEQRQRASMYPNVQFKMTEKTSTYDADGIISVQFPSQNKSPTAIDQLKVVFGQRNVNSIFEILDETGPDTGIFEGTLSLSTIPSFSKFQITQNNNPSSRINIQFLEADVTFSSISHALALYHDLEFPDDTNIIHNDSRLSVHSDKKAYLAGKEIQISGFSEPDETINVTLLAHKGSGMFFEKVQSDKNGEFKTELILPDDASSGMYSLAATSTKNDKQEITSLIVTSIDALESHSISVPPLQQSKMGLGADQIVCKQVWKSVLKPGGEIPACVKLPTYHKLLERGWIPVS